MTVSLRLSTRWIYLLAAESCRSENTVRAVLRGEGNSQSREAVLQAAKRLGLELPTPRVTAPGAPLGIEAHSVRSQAR
jgi:hypothetical protein